MKKAILIFLVVLGLAVSMVFSATAGTSSADGNQRRYVVLINGSSGSRYWDNAKYAYDMFHDTYGMPDENIYFVNYEGLAPDGTNPGNIIDYRATKANLQSIFSSLAQTVDADDMVVVWIVGDGYGYFGPNQHPSSGAQSLYGYLGSNANASDYPGDDQDYLESDFKLRSYYMGGEYPGRYGLETWKVYRKYKSATQTYYWREKRVSHFNNVYFEKKGTVSDNDIYIERIIDYLAGDLNRDGIIDTALGETYDFNNNGIPPYDPVTGAFDEGDWGNLDDYYDDVKTIDNNVPARFQTTYAAIDIGLDNKLDLDLNHDPANPKANATDYDNDGLFDGVDVNNDNDKDDWVSIDETVFMPTVTDTFSDDDMRNWLAPINAGAIVFVTQTCFGGGFVEDLSAPNRIIIANSEEETQSFTDRFIRNLMSALTGLTYPVSSGDPSTADANHDGKVDFAEAFNFASSNDWGPNYELPQYDDNGDGVSHTHFLPNGGDGDFGSTVSLVAGPDNTPPTVPQVSDSGSYTAVVSQLSASWRATDPESVIAEYQYQIRQVTPDGAAVTNWTSVGELTSSTATGLSLEQGRTYFFAVQAKNRSGLWGNIGYSDGIKVDVTAPEVSIVTDSGTTTSSTTVLTATCGSADPESGIKEYLYRITEGSTTGTIIRDFTSNGSSTIINATGLNLTPGQAYFFTVIAVNGAGLQGAPGHSDGITVVAPTVILTTPNGGETWKRGSTYTIRWNYSRNPGNKVKIELLMAGAVNRTIISSTSVGSNGSGSYSWKISNSQTKGTDYKVRVTSTSNLSTTDSSDGNFSIQ
jgi:hypothetical protein